MARRPVRILNNEVPMVQEIFDALSKALENLPDKIMREEKFAAMAITAVLNLVCRIALKVSLPKKDLLEALGKVWDEKEAAAKEKVWN